MTIKDKKKVVKMFIRDHVWMPKSKRVSTKHRREIVEKIRAKDKVYNKLFEEAIQREYREMHVWCCRILILVALAAIGVIAFNWARWKIPLLFAGRFWSFLFSTILYAAGIFCCLMVVRTLLDRVYKAFWGAEADARAKYKKLREAEAASRKVSQTRVHTGDMREGGVSERYIRNARKRHAGAK